MRDLPWNLRGICRWNFPCLYSPFLKKLAVRTKWKSIKVMDQHWIKETGKRTCCPWILPRQNDQPSNLHKIWRRDHSFEDFMHSHGYKTTVFIMWKYRSFVSYWMEMNLGWYVPVLFYNIRMGTLINKTHLKGALIGRRALNRITVLEAVLTGKQPRENIQCWV